MEHGSDLFRALELAHYAERFRGALFVVSLPNVEAFRDLMLDIKVLTGYHIRVLLTVPDPEHLLEEAVLHANKRGSRFHLSLATELLDDENQATSDLDFDRLQKKLSKGETPIIALHTPGTPVQTNQHLHPVLGLARSIATKLDARKLFLAGAPVQSLRNASRRSHVLLRELSSMKNNLTAGDSSAEWLDFAEETLTKNTVPDLILFEGRPGELYQETFTHDGAGLLFNDNQSEQIRNATVGDVMDIALLLRPEIESGRILPVSENQIERDISAYWVFEINGLLAGLARLRPFGDWAELSQFATLSRYRGKGRARDLAIQLEQEAKLEGFTRVFALSIDSRMWDFFTGLGFQETPRETLPVQWLENYDLSRPSRAFVKTL